MEFLKSVFGDKALTYAELEAALKDNKEVKIANLAGGAYVDKGKFDAKVAELTAANAQITQLTEAAKAFDGVDVKALKQQITDAEKRYQDDMAAVRKGSAIDMALMGAKARNVKAARALLDESKISLNADGTLSGLDIKALQTSDPYLFEIEQTKDVGAGQKGGKPGSEKPDGGGLDDEILSGLFGSAK